MHDDQARRSSGTVALSISGMTCGGCIATVTRVLSNVAGVAAAKVDLLGGGRALVEGTARPEELVHAVETAGFEARLSMEPPAGGQGHEHGGSPCC